MELSHVERSKNNFPVTPGLDRPSTDIELVALPTQGRLEREHLYHWIVGEEFYARSKWDRDREIQRFEHDEHLRQDGLSDGAWWPRQITQYLDRARLAFEAAREMREGAEVAKASTSQQKFLADARRLEMLGQQALAKSMMTLKGCVESSIRVFGPMPEPGHSSGEVKEWT